ncbi:hypothetical protein F2Q68_00035346 [Brassica cretica]|uniref:Uncharacterized protein n=1 Tax=Brassica cretica TaxID=69181 RepID=A0A8S9GVY9_BRACR|nr:hypothetical protein F2Q68_00035346 [Brassica cretica]
MDHMFGDLSTKYDNVAGHMRQMDIQIAQTAESVKRQHGTLHGKTDKNPKECNAVQLMSEKQLSEPEKRRFTKAEKGKQKESEQLPADTPGVGRNTEPAVGTSSPGPKQPAEAVRPIPEVVPPREYIPKVPYPVPAKTTHDALHAQLYEGIDLRKNITGERIHDSFQGEYGKNGSESKSGQLSEPEKRRFTTAEKGKQKETKQLPADTPAVERNTEPAVGTSSPGPEQPAEAVRPIPEVVPPREYIPKVPYPVPAKATRKDREEMKCRKMLEDLTVRLPLMDVIQMMPSMRSFMKGLISGKISEESEFMTVSKDCSVVFQNRQI